MDGELLELTEIDVIEEDLPKSSNFGGGMELLMNDRAKEAKSISSSAHLENINDLEQDLDKLLGDIPMATTTDTKPKVSFSSSNDNKSSSSLGHLTSSAIPDDSATTWDGYGKFNEIPLNPDRGATQVSSKARDDDYPGKLKLVNELRKLEKKGVSFDRPISMETPYDQLDAMLKWATEERMRENGIKFQRTVFMTCVNGLEMLNQSFDPFDLDLEGLHEQTQENINQYDEIFAELYEKYKSRISLTPELKLLFTFVGNVTMLNITNKMYKAMTATTAMENNPDLMRALQQTSMQQMSARNPNFGNFVNHFMPNAAAAPPATNRSSGPLPPPIATQSYDPPSSRPGNNDSAANEPLSKRMRTEMRGPSDISDILSGIRTRNGITDNSDAISVISDSSAPKRSARRRKTTQSNTVNLDM